MPQDVINNAINNLSHNPSAPSGPSLVHDARAGGLSRTEDLLDQQEPDTALGRSTPWSRKAVRWWYVLRYYRKSQLAMRVVNLCRQKSPLRVRLADLTPLDTVPRQRPETPGLERVLESKLSARCANGSAARARQILAGQFRFLNEQLSLPDPLDWRLKDWPDVPHLWRFHLHYHEFLLDLAAEGLTSGDSAYLDQAWNLVSQWIEHNPPEADGVTIDAWHPYCISRRLPVWILLWKAAPPPGELSGQVLRSMAAQARFLERNLEWDVRGNHLLENLRALALAGVFFEDLDADRWLGKAERILRRELAEQILPHGEHFERSPMYHCQVLEALLDIRDATATVRPGLSRLCHKTATRMAEFLKTILHPDGEIPLLGDSCHGETPPPGHLIARSESEATGVGKPSVRPTGQAAADQTGAATTIGSYWLVRNGEDFLLFDGGPVGPDHLPGHAHADLLSFEASIAGQRLFVDTGVFHYQDGPMRRLCRGSAAHNVLVVDDVDQCDMWSSFRMGYRGWPSNLETGSCNGFAWARATHNAYRRLGVPTVGRWLACRPGGPWLCVDWIRATGRHRLTNYLHLHPDVVAELLSDGDVRLTLGSVVVWLRPLTPGEVTLENAWYCPAFGHRKKHQVVRWRREMQGPVVCGWHWTVGDRSARASLTGSLFTPRLRWTGEGQTVELNPWDTASDGPEIPAAADLRRRRPR